MRTILRTAFILVIKPHSNRQYYHGFQSLNTSDLGVGLERGLQDGTNRGFSPKQILKFCSDDEPMKAAAKIA